MKRSFVRIGGTVQKEELLHLHMLLVHIRKYYENGGDGELPANRYEDLSITPVHIHKNKKCHKEAILTLGDEIVDHIRAKRPIMVDYTTEIGPKQIAIEH